MELFRPDLFSDPIARTARAPGPIAAAVRAVLESHYAHFGEIGRVEQFGGAEINSKNFLVTAGELRLVVKSVDKPLDEVVDVLTFAQHLYVRTPRVPRVMASSTGALAVGDGARCWYVLEWISGPHFSGAAGELALLASAIRQVSEALPEVTYSPNRRFPVLAQEDADFAREVEDRRPSWPALLGGTAAELLQQHWQGVRGLTEGVLQALSAWRSSDGVMHVDLHPHNVMISPEGAASLLDLDSFQQCAPDVAVAFGCLKLLRQAFSLSGERGVAARRVAEGFAHQVGAAPDRVGDLARSEVLRRIFVLLRLSLREGNRSWNHVLPVHLCALAESRELFG